MIFFVGMSIGILLVHLIMGFVIPLKKEQISIKFCSFILAVFYPLQIWQVWKIDYLVIGLYKLQENASKN